MTDLVELHQREQDQKLIKGTLEVAKQLHMRILSLSKRVVDRWLLAELSAAIIFLLRNSLKETAAQGFSEPKLIRLAWDMLTGAITRTTERYSESPVEPLRYIARIILRDGHQRNLIIHIPPGIPAEPYAQMMYLDPLVKSCFMDGPFTEEQLKKMRQTKMTA